MFDKVQKFSKMAYSRLRPELGRLRKYAGPHAEEMLGMTPVGQMLGLGNPGTLDQVYGNPNPFHNPHKSEIARRHGTRHAGLDPSHRQGHGHGHQQGGLGQMMGGLPGMPQMPGMGQLGGALGRLAGPGGLNPAANGGMPTMGSSEPRRPMRVGEMK